MNCVFVFSRSRSESFWNLMMSASLPVLCPEIPVKRYAVIPLLLKVVRGGCDEVRQNRGVATWVYITLLDAPEWRALLEEN